MKKKIYIAGKVTGLPQKEVIEKFEEAQLEIESKGFYVVNPIEVVGDWNCDWQTAMKKCVKSLLDCDAVVILPDWKESRGAKIERQLADDLHIEIFNYTKFGLEVMVKNLE